MEIREKIIRILLQPVLSKWYNGRTQIEDTRFNVAALPDPFDDLNYADEDLYAISEKRAVQYSQAMRYPGRKWWYDLSLNPVRNEYHKGPRKDWLFLQWLHHASYVSTSFRYELGRVLWSRVMIRAGDDDEEVDEDGLYGNHFLDAIQNVLLERPAALQGVKRLNISLTISNSQDINRCGNFDYWCDFIAENLELEDIWFKINATEPDLKTFLERQQCRLDALAATSRLRVGEYFEVEVKRHYEEDADYDSDVELDPDHGHALFELMLPLTLRGREPETEEEKYLQARAEEVEETEELEEAEETEITEEAEQTEESTEDSSAD